MDLASNGMKRNDWFPFCVFVIMYNIYIASPNSVVTSCCWSVQFYYCSIIIHKGPQENLTDIWWGELWCFRFPEHSWCRSTYTLINQHQAPRCKPLICGFGDTNKYHPHGSYLKIQKQRAYWLQRKQSPALLIAQKCTGHKTLITALSCTRRIYFPSFRQNLRLHANVQSWTFSTSRVKNVTDCPFAGSNTMQNLNFFKKKLFI